MIWKMGVTMGALLPLAARAVAGDRGATMSTSEPVIWHFLGYPFEAGSMIAALFACFAVRFYVTHKDRRDHRWTVDIPVTALALMFAAGAVIRLRPDPALALFYGTGLGALGEGIVTIALNYVRSKMPGADKPGA